MRSPTALPGDADIQLSSLDQLGRAGFMAIGDSAEEASAIYDHVPLALMERANHAVTSDRRVRVAA